MDSMIAERYHTWLRSAEDTEVLQELKGMEAHPDWQEDAFYRELEFGTGGLRGVIGAGTNRMNIYTVGRASQGLADYVKAHFPEEKRRIAISYDSRIKSDLFARTAAEVFAANGIQVYLYDRLMPTPCLSFAVRALACAAGVMVTASHNPAKYNGYKVYGPDGCQITTKAAAVILEAIEAADTFADVKRMPFEEGLRSGAVQYVPEDVLTAFIEKVKGQSCLGDARVNRDIAIVYTPLNGTGREPVLRALRETGFTRVTVVPEQEMPDGHFPTCPYPNPEIREAMALGIRTAEKEGADLLLATDPDCDRVGIAVRGEDGQMTLLTGNETGMLLLDYICARRREMGTMPEHPVMVKTIVTTDMAEAIAAHYGVETVNVLTGFKYIGETIGRMEAQGREKDYIFGFEESYGVLSGTYVRDKDAVNGALLICEMFAWHAAQGKSLIARLGELYREYGYCLNTLHSYTFEGSAGFARMQEIMAAFRSSSPAFAGQKTLSILDYSQGLDGLPKSDVLKFILESGSVVVRPSGTEPKLKAYISVRAGDRTQAEKLERQIATELGSLCCPA